VSTRRPRRGAAALHQRGFALIAILALAAMITAFLIAIGMNRSSSELANERDERTMNALRQAKAALITYASNEEWQYRLNPPPPPIGNTGYFQPGALPCPDKDDDDGFSDCTGSTARSMIGRLPWRTLNIDNLRDSSGEELWYAVSQSFRKLQCPTANCTTINSDTQGQLSLTGATSMNNVVAVVIAPGIIIQGQTRPSTPTAAAHNDPANYVESFSSGDWVHLGFATNASPTDTLNDRLLVITQADLMAVVEPVVAANIERDVVPNMQDYYAGWQVYPFPVQFNPGLTPQDQYQGAAGPPAPVLTRGLLPVTTDTTFARWDTSSIVVSEIAGGTGAGTGAPSPAPPPYMLNSPPDCSSSTGTQIICKIDYSFPPWNGGDRPNIQVRAKLLNAGRSFPKPFKIADAVMTGIDGNPVPDNGTSYKYWSPVPPDPPFPNTVPTVTNTINSSGDGTVVFTGRLQNNGNPPTGTGGKVTITITLNFEPFTDASGWFAANEWYRQTYYAVVPGFLPSPGGGCNPGGAPPCLTVNNLRPSYAFSNDKRVILVLAGRSLNGNARPSITPADYFENANLVAANNPTTSFTFENRPGAPTSINDRVIVVSP
jgi:type II secretory pathway pseudopilin PulG